MKKSIKRDLFNKGLNNEFIPTIYVDGVEFFVAYSSWNNTWSILKRVPYMVTDACIFFNSGLWMQTPTFESMIHAVKFMLDNADKLF